MSAGGFVEDGFGTDEEGIAVGEMISVAVDYGVAGRCQGEEAEGDVHLDDFGVFGVPGENIRFFHYSAREPFGH